MVEEIFKKVKSPFTDELIGKLIEQYISCGCDDNLFYRKINGIDSLSFSDNSITRDLINKIYLMGVEKNQTEIEECEDMILYDINDSWVVLSSKLDPMNVNQGKYDEEIQLLYRIYINLKGRDKSDFILQYINMCQNDNIPYELKFSRKDGRNDEIVILSNLDMFQRNIDIIENLTENIELGQIPMLIGEYKNGIGIAEEYYDRLYSPTKAKLALIRSSVKKFLCDHKDEFLDQLSNEDKDKIKGIVYSFEFKYTRENKRIERMGQEYIDRKRSFFQKKGTIECAREHIETERDAYVCGTGLLDLNSIIQKVYSQNPDVFINEVNQNFNIIGTQVWGFSQDFIFTNETEERFLKEKKNEKELSEDEIATELEIISRKGIVMSVQSDLIEMQEEKEEKEEDKELK